MSRPKPVKPREEPLYLAFSIEGAERLRLEAMAKGMGYRDCRWLAADVFRVGLMMTFARYEPVKKCRTVITTSDPSSARAALRKRLGTT